MNIPLYHVDAFSSRLFGGNPAVVCPLEHWIEDKLMQPISDLLDYLKNYLDRMADEQKSPVMRIILKTAGFMGHFIRGMRPWPGLLKN